MKLYRVSTNSTSERQSSTWCPYSSGSRWCSARAAPASGQPRTDLRRPASAGALRTADAASRSGNFAATSEEPRYRAVTRYLWATLHAQQDGGKERTLPPSLRNAAGRHL